VLEAIREAGSAGAVDARGRPNGAGAGDSRDDDVKRPIDVVGIAAYGEGAGGPERAGNWRSAARRGGNREKDTGGKSETAGAADRVVAAMEVIGGAVEVIEAEAAEVISRLDRGLIPCKTMCTGKGSMTVGVSALWYLLKVRQGLQELQLESYTDLQSPITICLTPPSL
jgi:hypothetical protein